MLTYICTVQNKQRKLLILYTMIILHNSNGTLKDKENLKQGFCKKYKGVKIGSSKCQKCKFFNNSICTNSKNN